MTNRSDQGLSESDFRYTVQEMSPHQHAIDDYRLHGDPYGVPTGSVPRASVSGYQRTEPLPAGELFHLRPCPDCGVPHGALHKADCPRRGRNPVTGERMTADEVLARDPVAKLLRGDAIDKAVNDYLFMERKARAWDDLVRFSKQEGSTGDATTRRLFDLVMEMNHGR